MDLCPEGCTRANLALAAHAGLLWKDMDCRSRTFVLVPRWRCTGPGPAPMSLAVGLPVAARLALPFWGKTTRRPPLAFATIGKALAMSGEFLCHPLHQFGIDALPLLQLLHEGQRLRHFTEFLLCGGTMEAIDLVFAPHRIEGSTAKFRCIAAITVAITVPSPSPSPLLLFILGWTQSFGGRYHSCRTSRRWGQH